MRDIDIVIVNYNVRDLLRACLESVERSVGPLVRTIVVDNASTDGSVMMMEREFPNVSLFPLAKNVGYSAGNNVALNALDGEARYVLLLNPDTVLPADGLRAMVEKMDADPTLGASGPKLVRPDGSLDLACRRSFPTPEVSLYRMAGLSRLFPKSKRFGRYNMTYLHADVEADVDSVVGAFMLVRREAFQAVGPLDERFFMYGEDLDWAKRIKDAGWRIRYIPSVQVLHHKGSSSKQAVLRSSAAFYQAMWLFYQKHYAQSQIPPLNWLIYAAIHFFWGVSRARNQLTLAGARRVG